MDVEVALIEEADLDRNLTAIRRGFETHPFAADILPTLTRDFYLWKHWPPAGRALVASVRQNKEDVLAIVAASPVRIACSAGIVRAWQVGDIATVPEFRGRGLFRRSLDSLLRKIPEEELVFCFPNSSALPEFLRRDFHLVGEFACHVRPVMPWPEWLSRESEVQSIEHFDIDISPGRDLTVLRDANYLDWRYRRCPTRRYDAAYCGSLSDPHGIVVVRPYRAMGVGIALIMDMHANNLQTTTTLLTWAARWARQQQLHAVMTMADPPPLGAMWRRRFARIPSAILPKRQVCVARVSGIDTQRRLSQFGRWHLQAGDWDGL